MSGAFASMAVALGAAPPALPTPAERTAARVRRCAEALRHADNPDTLAAAAALEAWLAEGGDLAARLGLKAARGRRFDLPAVAGPLQRRDAAIRTLAAELREPGISERAHLARLVAVLKQPERAAVIRESTGAATVPTSATRLRTIIRAP